MKKFFANRFFFVVDRFFQSQLVREKIVNVIIFAQMNVKHYYDRKHQLLIMKKNDYAFIRLHRNYKISITNVLDKKYNYQFVNLFKILQKIDVLIYRLNLFSHWRIYSILNVAQLKSTFSLANNFYRRHSNFIFVENDIFIVKFFEIKRLLNKRQIKTRESKYLIRWKNYESKKNVWKNLLELKYAMNLIRNYENVLIIVIFTILNRLQKFIVDSTSRHLKKFFVKFDKQKFVNVFFEQKFAMIISSRKFFANDFVVVNFIIVKTKKFFVNDFVVVNFIIVKTRKFFANVLTSRLIFVIDVMIFWKTIFLTSKLSSIFTISSFFTKSSMLFVRRFARFFFL